MLNESIPYEFQKLEGAPIWFCSASLNSFVNSQNGLNDEEEFPKKFLATELYIAKGRGLTEAQAKNSCSGEIGEIHGINSEQRNKFNYSNTNNLNFRYICPNSIMCLSNSQFNYRNKWNKIFGEIDFIPKRSNEMEPIFWIEYENIITESRVQVPAGMTFMNCLEEETFCCDSNGCAAGETKEQAIVSAFLELVERDATGIWWYSQTQRTCFDLTAVNDPKCIELIRWCQSRDRSLQIIDITTDLKIPVFVSISAEADGSNVLMGYGAHFNPEHALISALTEMLQLELNSQMANEMFGSDATKTQSMSVLEKWTKIISLHNQPQLNASSDQPKILNDFVKWPHLGKYEYSVNDCINVCKEHNLQLLVLDLTREEIGIPVVRAIVPGLRHYKARFAPGRLYDVPIKLGWRDESFDESQLNPIPLLI